MGWYLHKSVRMGPVRWNISRSGIGVSTGIRGLRIGTGPRGPYVAGGRGGLYFRQNLTARRTTRGSKTSTRGSVQPTRQLWRGAPQAITPQAPAPNPTGAPMEYLPETIVQEYAPSTQSELAQYITAQRAHTPWAPLTIVGVVLLNLIVLAYVWPLALLTLPLTVWGAVNVVAWDRKQTHVALNYELEGADLAEYQRLCSSLQALASIQRLERVEARQLHGDYKHQAGATTTFQLAAVNILSPGNVRWLETNIPVWGIQWRQGQLMLLFLPDQVVIQQAKRAATLAYSEIQIMGTSGRFVEKRTVPADAQVIAQTWQYVNKNGTPDRRFANNPQWPVLQVGYITLQSAAGLNLMLQASNAPTIEAFVQTLHTYRPFTPPSALPIPLTPQTE